MKNSRERRTSLIIVGILLIVAVGGFFTSIYLQQVHTDEALQKVIASADGTTFYTQEVITETSVSGRHIKVEGTYTNDRKNSVFASFSTTTVQVPEFSHPIRFSLENISIPGTVYVRAKSPNPELIGTIPLSGDWKSFPEREIPSAYREIAIVGPIMDNLVVFSEKGAHVRQGKTTPNDTTFGSPLTKIELRLIKTAKDRPGALSALYERVSEGEIEAWIDEASTEVRYLVFKNPPYYSTTTISSINTPSEILVPSL